MLLEGLARRVLIILRSNCDSKKCKTMTSRLWYIQQILTLSFPILKKKLVVAHLERTQDYKSKNLQGNEELAKLFKKVF
jgi:hypothetical protein